MAALSGTDHDTISQAWELSGDLLVSLQRANSVYESERRTQVVDQLTALEQQILDLGFFEKTDFTDQERTALLDAASQIRQAQDAIKDSHDLTLMELTIDLAQLIQKLSLSEYESMLQAKWLSARRPAAAQAILPQDIPGDVRDDFTVGLFSMMQGNLNQHAGRPCRSSSASTPMTTRVRPRVEHPKLRSAERGQRDQQLRRQPGLAQ